MRAKDPRVVHVVSGDDPHALAGLRRTEQIIESQAVNQVVVRLNGRPGVSRAFRSRALRAELAQLSRGESPVAVHLHGWEACLAGSLALTGELEGRVLFSPYRAQFGPSWALGLLGRLLRTRLAPFDHAPLAASLAEAEGLRRLLHRSAEVVPSPVSQVFFEVLRREDARPRIVARGRGGEAVDLVTRLCVLLNGREPRVAFSWLAEADSRTRAQLEAAHVQVIAPADERDEAQWLAHAWLFIAASDDGAPSGVARAMSAGVPCLVCDTPMHRALIHHGENGFVCVSDRDFVERAILLLRDAEERRRIGDAAREAAERRFTERDIRRALLRAYGFPAPRPLGRAPVVHALVPPTHKERNACTPLEGSVLQDR
jgi:hypothetical protein